MIGRKNKHAVYWALQFGGWSFYAFLHIMLLFLADPENIDRTSLIFIVFTAAYFLVSSHVYRHIVLKLGWLGKPILSVIPKVLFSAFLLGIAWYIFEMSLSYAVNTLNAEQDFKAFQIMVFVIGAMAWYLLWAAVYFLYHYVERTNESLKSEAAIYEIELNQLKSQLNPHFIFNALNSIRALIDEDPVKSKTAITQLSNILRNSLIVNRSRLVDLKDELKTVRDYLALESIRFEERLKVALDIDPDAGSSQVPPLMIQTLVENSIKHGISRLTYGGEIRILAKIDDIGCLLVEIRNTGQISPEAYPSSTGYGLENTRRRLDLLYGPRSSFFIGNEDDNTVLTKIVIPQSLVYESIDH